MQKPDTTTQPPTATTQPPVVTPQQPIVTPQQPADAPQRPIVVAQEPVDDTQLQSITTQHLIVEPADKASSAVAPKAHTDSLGPTAKSAPERHDDNLEEVTAPQAVDSSAVRAAAATPDTIQAATATSTVEIDPSAASARTAEIAEAAKSVASAIISTPSLVRGDGEVVIRLKPNVLDGSEIKLEAKGKSITIEMHPATVEAAQAIERSRAQFVQQLTERMPTFQFTVAVTSQKPNATSLKKAADNEAD
jgi:hypothetical protein